jgi:hypothetical protein
MAAWSAGAEMPPDRAALVEHAYAAWHAEQLRPRANGRAAVALRRRPPLLPGADAAQPQAPSKPMHVPAISLRVGLGLNKPSSRTTTMPRGAREDDSETRDASEASRNASW